MMMMDQVVMVTFKACHLRQTFTEMVGVLDSSDRTIKHYWHSFNILRGINNLQQLGRNRWGPRGSDVMLLES
jgi:hypothetical protein